VLTTGREVQELEQEWNTVKEKVIQRWSHFLSRLNSPDAAIKIHSRELRSPIAKYWYDGVMNNRSHQIFVVERKDRFALGMSYLLADAYGFWENEKPSDSLPESIIIKPQNLDDFERHIKQYLNNYPSYGDVITYETAPSSLFNKNMARLVDQQSHKKIMRISNLDWASSSLAALLLKYKTEWDTKITTLSRGSWSFDE
jgi:hypothetical protein